MSEKEAGAGSPGISAEVRVNKRIVPFEEGSPDQEPLFVNCAQVAFAGGVAYIDVGVIPLDEIVLQPQTVTTFLVLTRLVIAARL